MAFVMSWSAPRGLVFWRSHRGPQPQDSPDQHSSSDMRTQMRAPGRSFPIGVQLAAGQVPDVVARRTWREGGQCPPCPIGVSSEGMNFRSHKRLRRAPLCQHRLAGALLFCDIEAAWRKERGYL